MAGVGPGRGQPTKCGYVEFALSATIADDLVGLRRDLHRLPEIGLYLPQAQQRILGELGDLDFETTTGASSAQSRPSCAARRIRTQPSVRSCR